jgi:hypothetical protein
MCASLSGLKIEINVSIIDVSNSLNIFLETRVNMKRIDERAAELMFDKKLYKSGVLVSL